MAHTLMRNLILIGMVLLAEFPNLAAPREFLASVEANIRGGTYADSNVDIGAQGYIMVKYDAALNNARKAYFLFDLTSTVPNTNYPMVFTINTGASSQRQHVQLWCLNQAYPALSPGITWNTAQANATTSNSLLTNGDFTATMVADALVLGGANITHSFTINPPVGPWIIGGKVVLVLATVNDLTNQAGGLRIQPANAALAFQTVDGAPPTISTISNFTVTVNQISATNTFTVGDAEDGPDALAPVAISSNEAIVPTANIFIEGSNANRRIYFLAGGQPGIANIVVTVTDSAGNPAQTTFTVTVQPDNLPPVISAIPHANTLAGTTTAAIPFTVNDPETPSGLAVTGASGNLSLVDNIDIVIGGTGTNRTVTVTPIGNQTGVAIITLTVSDGVNTTNTAFALMVLPAENVVFCEHFDYPDGNLNPLSYNFWFVRSSGSTRLQVAGQQALIRSASSAESLMAPLAHGPYAVGQRILLYTSCRATWTSLPTNSGAILHLNDGTTGVPGLVSRLATITNGMDGIFRLRLANGPGPYVEFPRDLTTNVTYNLVTRYDVDLGTTAFWIDASSEAETNVLMATDIQTPVSIVNVGFRQNVGMGRVLFDDLKVTVATKPTITHVAFTGGNGTIEFAAGAADTPAAFVVEGAALVAGPYTAVNSTITLLSGGTFRATFAITGSQSFFRLKRQPMSLP